MLPFVPMIFINKELLVEHQKRNVCMIANLFYFGVKYYLLKVAEVFGYHNHHIYISAFNKALHSFFNLFVCQKIGVLFAGAKKIFKQLFITLLIKGKFFVFTQDMENT